jgi:hypothetical protein
MDKKRKQIKKGDIVELVHGFKTGSHEFHKGDVCVVTYRGLFDLDIELKDNPSIWAIDLSYDDVKKIDT